MKVLDKFADMFFGLAGGLTKKDLDVYRHKFSDLLPYVACNAPQNEETLSVAERGKYNYSYLLNDNSIGFIFECSPMVYAGDAFSSLSTVLKLPLPAKTVVQTVLYADSYIEDVLDAYKSLRYSNPDLNEIYAEQVEQLCNFYRKGAEDGLWQLSGTPMRKFRLYISLKIPIKTDLARGSDDFLNEVERYKDLVGSFKATLEGNHLQPSLLHPDKLVSLLFRIFNPDLPHEDRKWNILKPLNKQIISAETLIERVGSSLKIGSFYAKCLTPKSFPKEIDHTTLNNMVGYYGKAARSADDDINQIQCPFIISAAFIYENLRAFLESKASLINYQQAAGTFAQSIFLRQQEMFDMKFALENGETYIRSILQIWLFDREEKRLSEKVNRVASMWKNLNIETQKERSFIMPKLFVSALPLGLYGKDYKDLQRDFILPATSAAHLMPIQAGYLGLGSPYMLFMDRRAQLTAIDILYTGKNKNFLVTGGTGGGKSFFLNYLLNSYRSIGAKARIIDVGKSYEKMANIFGGQFIQFSGSKIVLNFFEGIGNIKEDSTIESDKEDYAAKMSMLTGVIATMANKTNDPATPEQITLIETAIRDVYRQRKNETTIDDIVDYLANLPGELDRQKRLAEVGYYLSLALQKYCRNGEYGMYFSGKSNITFNNPLAVVELDGVPEDLRKVIVLAFASMIEDEIYNGDRVTPTIVIIDEAWQTLSENPAAARFVEGLYRKIRKYNGSVGIATQALGDTNPNTGKLRHIGEVVRTQSHIKFILPDESLDNARDDKLINFSDFEWYYQIKKIPANTLPRYSEFYIKSDISGGVVRLATDLFTYFCCSSDATDNTFLTFWSNKYRTLDPTLNKTQSMKLAIQKAVDVCNAMGGLQPFKDYVKTTFRQEMRKDNMEKVS